MRHILTFLVLAASLMGCSSSSEPPQSGEPLKKHLLDLVRARDAALSEGDLAKMRSCMLPYIREANRMQWEQRGLTVPDRIDPKKASLLRKTFDQDTPIEFEQHGNWVRLRQVKGERALTGFFVQENKQWWIVQIVNRSAKPTTMKGVAHLEITNYWPDRIEAYFLIPSIELEAKLSSTPSDSEFFDQRISLWVTNRSDTSISKDALSRRLTDTTFMCGEDQSAVKRIGGDGFKDIKPGERFYVGDFQVQSPQSDAPFYFYFDKYRSNTIPLSARKKP